MVKISRMMPPTLLPRLETFDRAGGYGLNECAAQPSNVDNGFSSRLD
jgi:hypothetical protein